MKVGICFGGYCPLHRGHLEVIMKAKKENDKCLIVVCGYEGEPRAEALGITLDEKEIIIKEIFRKDDHVEVIKISDTDLGLDQSMSMGNWKIWTDEVMKSVGKNDEPRFYVSEPFYEECLGKLGYSVVKMERVLGLSGTAIRENPIKFWPYINDEFKPLLAKRILVTGTASEGKSTLCRDISTYFNLPLIEEMGRNIMEFEGKTDIDLGYVDFSRFLYVQHYEIESSLGPVVISDTDNLVTLMYAEVYKDDPDIPKFNEDDYRRLVAVYSELERIEWDKIYLLPPKNNFVDDGTRYMKQSTMEERKKNYDILVKLLKSNGYWDKVEILDGNYYENFCKVKEYINGII